MRVLVTGGKGFIGSAVMRFLDDVGHDAASFDRHDGLDVTDQVAVSAAVGDADAVIHLAGLLGTGELFDRACEAIVVNVQGSLNVIRACARHGVQYTGIEMPRVWPNVYQATKTCARTLATAWHQNKGLGTSHVRAFNAYGPGQKVHGVQKIVPTFATRAWAGLPIPIWGDGTQTVDLVYVDDVARVLVEALEFSHDETFDAGTGHPVSVLDVAREVHLCVGEDTGIEFLPMRPGETPTKVVATGEGWAHLVWTPMVRPDAFGATVEWYREPRP